MDMGESRADMAGGGKGSEINVSSRFASVKRLGIQIAKPRNLRGLIQNHPIGRSASDGEVGGILNIVGRKR